EDKNEDYHVFIDRSDQIVVTKLSNLKLQTVVPLKIGDGPNLLNTTPSKAYMLNISSYLIEAFPFFYLVNDKGFVTKKVSVNDLFRERLKGLYSGNKENLIITGMNSSMMQVENNKFILSVRR